jgi:predicted 2-oxoglutarate/Fe(II)-dependent dioxygenase YbiX
MDTKLERLLTIKECSEIINFVEENPNWDYYDNLDNSGNTSSKYFLRTLDDNDFVINKFKNYINSHFPFRVDIVNIYVLKYLQGGLFHRHIDRVEHRETHRDFVYNINVILNDDFTGGEFWVNDNPFIGNTPGIVYYYDSTQWHEVKPILSGTRYSMLCYIRARDLISKNTKTFI